MAAAPGLAEAARAHSGRSPGRCKAAHTYAHLPQCVSQMESLMAVGAQQAPSSCVKSQMWSRPPRRDQYGCVLLSH